jgi:hypothetical protein
LLELALLVGCCPFLLATGSRGFLLIDPEAETTVEEEDDDIEEEEEEEEVEEEADAVTELFLSGMLPLLLWLDEAADSVRGIEGISWLGACAPSASLTSPSSRGCCDDCMPPIKRSNIVGPRGGATLGALGTVLGGGGRLDAVLPRFFRVEDSESAAVAADVDTNVFLTLIFSYS